MTNAHDLTVKSCLATKIAVGTSPNSVVPKGPVPSVSCTIKADDDNGNDVFVGGPNVSATAGFRLKAGQALSGIIVNDLANVYLVGGANGLVAWAFWHEANEQ